MVIQNTVNSSVSQVIEFLLRGVKFNCIFGMTMMPSQQKLGIIFENKMSENGSYLKISTQKVGHFNLNKNQF